jgi:hypothetical protein
MANFSISPGVTISEIDNTFLVGTPTQAGAAIIGPTVKGPVEVPTFVTSYSDFQTIFGDSFISGGDSYSYLTSLAAYNYFNYGGTSLLVARVVSGSYTPASSDVNNNVSSTGGTFSSTSFYISSSYTASYAGGVTGGTIKFSIPSLAGTFTDYWIQGSTWGYDYYDANANTGYASMSFAPTVDEFGANIARFLSASSFFGVTNEIGAIFSGSYNASTDLLTITSKVSSSGINGSIIRFGHTPTGYVYAGAANNQFISSSTITGGTNGVSSIAFTLETLSEGIIMNNSGSQISGALASGSVDNVRWELTNPNTGSGTFNIVVRRGDDNATNKIVLESWNNISLDPNSPRYVSKVIGNQSLSYNSVTNQMDVTGDYPNKSRYVRVKTVNYNTPNYLDANGQPQSQYTASLPIAQSGSFTGATGTTNPIILLNENISQNNTQGLVGSDYNNMISLLNNREFYQYNVISTPGLISSLHTTQVNNIITNTQDRGDSLYVVDLIEYSGDLANTITAAQTIDNSYAATYWPWVRLADSSTGKQVWSPASTVIPGVYANNDKISAPWFAPAGINRGGLSTVSYTKYKLTQGDRDNLYANNINPLATLPKQGVVVFGQKTLQKAASALDRVNVRRLLIELKAYIRQISDTVVFEQNTIATRTSFVSRVTPYLESIQQKQGLYAFKVVMDEANNGPAVIDNNQLVGQIYIQPTRTAEFISLDFILLPTGAQFPA